MTAESYGASDAEILLRHIFPNLVGMIVVQATISFSFWIRCFHHLFTRGGPDLASIFAMTW